MAIRTIQFDVSQTGVIPSYPQFAGVQGDHNATEVTFNLSSELIDAEYSYRFEYVDGLNNNLFATEPVELDENSVSSLLPRAWTQNGGNAIIRLVIYKLNLENEVILKVYSFDARLRFMQKSEGLNPTEQEAVDDLGELLEKLSNPEINVGTVETLATDVSAYVSKQPTTNPIKATFDFGIPKFKGDRHTGDQP